MNNPIISPVVALNLWRRPIAIIWGIVAICIVTFQRVFWRRAWSEVRKKALKVVLPLLANPNATTPIQGKPVIVGIQHARFHGLPALIFRSIAQAMFRYPLRKQISHQTAATLRLPRVQTCLIDSPNLAALADAAPLLTSPSVTSGLLNHRPASEFLTYGNFWVRMAGSHWKNLAFFQPVRDALASLALGYPDSPLITERDSIGYADGYADDSIESRRRGSMKLVSLALCLALSGCASVKAQAGPDGKITSLEYSAFLRKYDWSVDESPQGLKVRVGAQSEAEIVQSLLSAAAGAAATLAGKGVIP